MTSTLLKLRPAKVSNALRRRWFENRLDGVATDRNVPVTYLGTTYGGWVIPEGVVAATWSCWCVGAGGDISFEVELLRRYGARVRCFDPVEEFAVAAAEEAGEEPEFSVHQVAIADHDGAVRMQRSTYGGSKSLSSAGLYESDQWVEVAGRTIPSLMLEFGDRQIDLLKLDVEGAEYNIVPLLDLRALGVKVLTIQLHHNGSVRKARHLVSAVRAQDYELVATHAPVQLTFLRAHSLRTDC